MKKFLAIASGCLVVGLTAVAPSGQSAPTFYKDVLPILQNNCQTCHRPGEVAPMSLLTYEQARPWARAIKTKTDGQADAAVVCGPRLRACSPTNES